MRKVLLAALFSIFCYQTASAMPVDIAQQIANNSPVQQVQFYYNRHHGVKCYRELVVGPYVCHRIGRGWWL